MPKSCPLMNKYCIENACGWWVTNAKIRPYHKERNEMGMEVTDHTYKEGEGCALVILCLKEE